MPVSALPPLPTAPPASGAAAQPAGAEPGGFEAALANSGGGEPAPIAPAIAATARVEVAPGAGMGDLCLPASVPSEAPTPAVGDVEPLAGVVGDTPGGPVHEAPPPPSVAVRPLVAGAPAEVPVPFMEPEPLITKEPAPSVSSLPIKRKPAAGGAAGGEAFAAGAADRPATPVNAPAPMAPATAPTAGMIAPSPSDEGTASTIEPRATGHAAGHAAADPAAPVPTAEARVSAPLFSQTLDAAPRQHALPYDAAPAGPSGAATVVVREGRFGADVGIAIARARESGAGGDALLIRLDPRHMGRIDVRMTFDDDGTLRAVMRADSPAALDLLRRESVHLDRALADAGIRADAQSLRFESGGGSQQQQQHESARHRGFAPSDATAELHAAPDGAQPDFRSLRGSGQVDVLA